MKSIFLRRIIFIDTATQVEAYKEALKCENGYEAQTLLGLAVFRCRMSDICRIRRRRI